MKTRSIWMAVGVLAIALVGQIATYRLDAPASKFHASWVFHPNSLAEARGKAKSIVLAEVVSIERGEDLVVPAKYEPNGEDRMQTQRITVKVLKGYKGVPQHGEALTIFRTGGLQNSLEGDPPYKRGEKYLLLLEPGPKTMLRPISPEGRYRYNRNNTLVPMVDNSVTREVKGKSLENAERTLGLGN